MSETETVAASPVHRIPKQAWWFIASAVVAVALWAIGITLAVDAVPPPPRGPLGSPPPPPGPHPVGTLLVILSGLGAAATVTAVMLGLHYLRHGRELEQEARAEVRHLKVLARIDTRHDEMRVTLEETTIGWATRILTAQTAALEQSEKRHAALLEQMQQVAADSVDKVLNPESLAAVRQLGERIAAGPGGHNGTSRASRRDGA